MHRSRDRRLRLLSLALAFGLLATLASATTVAAAAPLPSCKVADTLTAFRGLSDWDRSILDTRYRLSSTYKPTDLSATSNAGLSGGGSVRKIIMADLKKMASAARSAGARFSVESAFRSYDTQKSTFAHWVAVHGYDVALTESARAGHSEHQLGTTLDLKSYGGGAPWDVNDWATTRAGAWIKANAWKYGFIVSYPKGKQSVTCYIYEPWHVRYVGRDKAKAVHNSKLTLREFLWREQHPDPKGLEDGGAGRP
jgi:zinc D-Ala-D-Ala carboxypeptidase